MAANVLIVPIEQPPVSAYIGLAITRAAAAIAQSMNYEAAVIAFHVDARAAECSRYVVSRSYTARPSPLSPVK